MRCSRRRCPPRRRLPSGALIRKLVVRFLSKSLLKFLPLVGGLVGFALNWMSTQALGRLTIEWLEGQAGTDGT